MPSTDAPYTGNPNNHDISQRYQKQLHTRDTVVSQHAPCRNIIMWESMLATVVCPVLPGRAGTYIVNTAFSPLQHHLPLTTLYLTAGRVLPYLVFISRPVSLDEDEADNRLVAAQEKPLQSMLNGAKKLLLRFI